MIKRNVFLIMMLGSAASVHAEDLFLPQPDTAIEAISAHPSVAAAEAHLSAAAAEARMRRAGEHEFHFNGSYIRRDVKGEGTFGEWDGSITRAIRLPGKAASDRKIGALGIEVAENARDDARHQVALLLKDYWFEWLEASTRENIDRRAVDAYRQELKLAERRHELKDAALLDVEAAQSALAGAEAALLKSGARRIEARRAMEAMFPGLVLPVQVPEIPAPSATEYSYDVWKKLILTRSHELHMAEKNAEQQLAMARRSRQDKIGDPTVGLRFFSERGGDEQGVGVLFSMPFGSSRRSAKSDAQRAMALAAEARSIEARRVIEEVANRDVTRAETGLQVWQQSLTAFKASEQVVTRVRRAVELGERDMVELMRALAQHYVVAQEEASARIMAHDAITQLRIDSHEIWVGAHHDHQEE